MSNFQLSLNEDHFSQRNLANNLNSLIKDVGESNLNNYNNFINGYLVLSDQLKNLDISLLNSIEKNNFKSNLALYASTLFFLDFKPTLNTSQFYDLKSNESSYFASIKNMSNKLESYFLRFIKSHPDKNFNDFYNSIFSCSLNNLKAFNNLEERIEINYDDKKFIYPEFNMINSISNYDSYFSKFRKEKIAGNTHALESMNSILNSILYYDSTLKSNPVLDVIDFPKVITLVGKSGTGKTMLITKALDDFSILANKYDKQFEVLSIDADTKSEFYSVSSRNLKNKFDRMYPGNSIYFLLIEEIDTKIHSRKNIQKNNSSELSFTGTFLECLDNYKKYLGNFLIITTSNRKIDSDNALKRRLSENIIFVNGLESIEDYITVYKNKLQKGIDNNYVKISDWKNIATQSKKFNFQGGDIKNICLNINNNLLKNISFNNSDFNIDNLIKKFPIIDEDNLLSYIDSYNQNKTIFSKDYLGD